MYDKIKIHEVQVLHASGISARRIAKITGLPRVTVSRMIAEPPVTDIGVARKSAGAGVGRPSKVDSFEAEARRILADEPDLLGVEVLRRLREKGYGGGKSAAFELIAKLRSRNVHAPIVRFEGLAGEFSQHDFGHVRVKYIDGKTDVVHFFASRLKWSRWSHVKIVPNENVESLVRALILGFESFGGVPLVCVFDNPKTIVIRRDDNVIEWNTTFARVPLDFRFGAELCWPRMANQKGSVENLVGWVKSSFFKVRRFHDREDLLRQLDEWLAEANTTRPSRATNIIPAERMAEERARMRPLSFHANEYALRYPVFVGPTARVEFQGNRYSMHPDAIHIAGTLYLYPDRVRIVAGRFEAVHERHPPNGVSTLPDHSAAALAVVSGKRAKLYYQRQRILELGPVAEAFLTELVHARRYTWKHDVERLYAWLQTVGADRLVEAMRASHARKKYGAEYVSERLQEVTR